MCYNNTTITQGIIMLKTILFISTLILLNACSNSNQDNTPYTKINSSTSWQWQLKGEINTNHNVDLFDIDLFDTPLSTINNLHKKNKIVICYFSAGSYEDWRADSSDFVDNTIGNTLDGWEDEKWLDIRTKSIREIMLHRLDLAKQKGCDGVEPDNVDGYVNNSGFKLTYNDQINYNIFLAKEAHSRGLSIGLKNDLNQISILEPHFDFAVNEQCYEYDECALLNPFSKNNKAIFNAEYNSSYIENLSNEQTTVCNSSTINKIQTLFLPIDLDDTFRISCDNL